MNAEDGSLELATELGQRPGASAIGFGSLWVAQPDRGVVARLDLETGSVTDHDPGRHLSLGRRGRRGVGVGDERRGRHREPDRRRDRTRSARRSTPAPAPSGIAFGDGALWVADSIGGALLRVDPTPRRSTSRRRSPASPRAWRSRRKGCGSRSRRRRRARRPDGSERRRSRSRSAAGRRRSSPRSDRSGSRTISTAPSPGSSPRPGEVEATIPVGRGPERARRPRRARSGSRNEFDDTVTRDRPGHERRRADRSASAARPRRSRPTARACGWPSAHRPPSTEAGP